MGSLDTVQAEIAGVAEADGDGVVAGEACVTGVESKTPTASAPRDESDESAGDRGAPKPAATPALSQRAGGDVVDLGTVSGSGEKFF